MNRWLVLLAGTLLQLCLGTVYAWSYFVKPLSEAYGWTNSQVSWAFSLAICCLGLAAALGGILLPRFGPRKLAASGGILFGLGYLLAALALHDRSLLLLYLGYGVVGGTGLGLGYVTPVATVAKWFPDKKGLATGIVIMGFGFGALLMSKWIAPALLHRFGGDLAAAFAGLGIVLGGASAAVALLLQNPGQRGERKSESPGCGAPQKGTVPFSSDENRDSPQADSIFSGRFLLMWSVFFCNIVAGISIIGFQSPLFQDLWRTKNAALSAATLAVYGANLIAASSIFNGLGRMLWGGLSDHLGPLRTFRVMLASQIAVFAFLAVAGDPWLFAAAVCYVLLCYGGGFGTMPAFVLDEFGARRMAVVYGAILTAWSAGGIVGPQIVAMLKDHCGANASRYSFAAGGGFVALGLVLSFLLRTPANGRAG